jgi:beta-glucanase (GH16 family)
MTPAATAFGAVADGKGMVHTTSHTTPTKCGNVQSGHVTFNPAITYGNFTIVARWFPGDNSTVSSATGFIGLDANGNEASITMGFHGNGWRKADEGEFKYQHGIYADVSKSHNRDYTTTGNVSIAKDFNTYGLLWSKEKVEWSFNGQVCSWDARCSCNARIT